MAKKPLKKRARKVRSEIDKTVRFRERRLKDIPIFDLEHPKPIPGYKATLPGPPGCWAKDNPGC
jgi:hypothetical protein